MVVSILLLVMTSVLAGMLLRCIKSFGHLSAKIDRSVASSDALRDVIEDTLTVGRTMVHRPPKLPEHRPYSPGQDDLEIFPPREHSA